MSKKCIYCKCEISDDRALDVCDRCGYKVWGDRMFKAILNNMNDAMNRGDLPDNNLVDRKRDSEIKKKFET
jgi:RimJ/RimL family protein N-acetyltransferase